MCKKNISGLIEPIVITVIYLRFHIRIPQWQKLPLLIESYYLHIYVWLMESHDNSGGVENSIKAFSCIGFHFLRKWTRAIVRWRNNRKMGYVTSGETLLAGIFLHSHEAETGDDAIWHKGYNKNLLATGGWIDMTYRADHFLAYIRNPYMHTRINCGSCFVSQVILF